MKRTLPLLFLFGTVCFGQSFNVNIPLHSIAHPIQAARNFHPKNFGWLLADSVLSLNNQIDYATTKRAVFPGSPGYGHYCEQNPLLTNGPCNIDVARFTGVKIGVQAFAGVQLIPIAFHRAGPKYRLIMTALDIGGAVALGIVDAHNIYELKK